MAKVSISLTFRDHCDELIDNLTATQVEDFKVLNDDTERVKYLYDHSLKRPIVEFQTPKNYDEANKFKQLGNEFFQNKKLLESIDKYNDGIVVCPLDNDRSKSLLAVLIANRSAVLYELDMYKECLDDINRILNSYPDELKHKILLRKGRCCIELKMLEEAKTALDLCLKKAEEQKLSIKKIKEIENVINSIKVISYPSKEIIFHSNSTFARNPEYPAASSSISFTQDPIQGRYAMATEDIPAGSFIVEEEAYCFAVAKCCVKTNCFHCGKNTITPVPCPNCAFTIFCSERCRDDARYHKIECEILPTVYKSGASINCLIALRMIVQNDFNYLWSIRNELGNEIAGIYDGADYRRVYNLCTNSDKRPRGEFVYYTLMAIYLLRLLKKTCYFAGKSESLGDEEAFIGGLLLRHIQILQFNAHEVSEMRNANENGCGYTNASVGGGVYPTLALFNHSCEPSIIRYNKNTKMIARAVKYINAGDIIYENYGPIYCTHEYHVRQKELFEKYYFECSCVPCKERWPLYDEITTNAMRIKCKHCPGYLEIVGTEESPMMTCGKCKKMNNIINTLLNLAKLSDFTEKAEGRFDEGDYEGAIRFYRSAVQFYHKYMVPPFHDFIKVQQRLRTCMLNDGNSEVFYHKKRAP